MSIASKFAFLINSITGQGEQANDHLFLWSGQYPDDQSREFILKESWLRRKIRLIKKGGKQLVQFTTNETQPPKDLPVKPYKNKMIMIGPVADKTKFITIDDLPQNLRYPPEEREALKPAKRSTIKPAKRSTIRPAKRSKIRPAVEETKRQRLERLRETLRVLEAKIFGSGEK